MILREMLTLVKLLCQDTETEIRAGICREIGAIARALGRKKASNTLLVELEELMRDEESLVIVEALRTFVDVVDMLDRNSFADVVSYRLCHNLDSIYFIESFKTGLSSILLLMMQCLPLFIQCFDSSKVLLKREAATLIGKLVVVMAGCKSRSASFTALSCIS